MVARQAHNLKVGGSIPSSATNTCDKHVMICGYVKEKQTIYWVHEYLKKTAPHTAGQLLFCKAGQMTM